MSYHTNFWGKFTVTPPVDAANAAELRSRLDGGWSEPAAWGDRSRPTFGCNWELSPDGTELQWNEVENFHEYDLWLRYLIEHFFAPRGHILNGEMRFSGEADEDEGVLRIARNRVTKELIEPMFGW